MKLRLIQLTGLFAFVVVILMLTPSDKGFGGAPSSHIPGQWINGDPANSGDSDYGRLKTPDNPGVHLIGGHWDPRGKSFYEMCGTNGDEYVGSFAWYYEGGRVSNFGAHAEEHDPKYNNDPNLNTNSNRHLTAFRQNIFTIHLDGYASTSANEASGSLSPSISNKTVIEVPETHDQVQFDGQGKITLEIPKIKYHRARYDRYYYRGCEIKTSKEYWSRPNEIDLYIIVHISHLEEKRAAGIDVGGDFKGAKANFTHTWEWKESRHKIRGRGFGVKASAGGRWDAYWNKELKLQGKTAEVYGNVEGAALPKLSAEFDTINSWCPPDTGYSNTQREYVPHVEPYRKSVAPDPINEYER